MSTRSNYLRYFGTRGLHILFQRIGHAYASLCPLGWRISTWSDWEYISPLIIDLQNIPSDSSLVDTTQVGSIYVKLNLIKDSQSLNVQPTGWVEGQQREHKDFWKEKQSANFWIIDDCEHDPTTHIHMTPKGYLKHALERNVIDEPDMVRRLSIRCVRQT